MNRLIHSLRESNKLNGSSVQTRNAWSLLKVLWILDTNLEVLYFSPMSCDSVVEILKSPIKEWSLPKGGGGGRERGTQ